MLPLRGDDLRMDMGGLLWEARQRCWYSKNQSTWQDGECKWEVTVQVPTLPFVIPAVAWLRCPPLSISQNSPLTIAPPPPHPILLFAPKIAYSILRPFDPSRPSPPQTTLPRVPHHSPPSSLVDPPSLWSAARMVSTALRRHRSFARACS